METSALSNMDAIDLKIFTHAAAGHEGVLSDHGDTIVVKPCTPAEIAFYQSANASYSRLAYFMPQFLGTLQLTDGVKSATISVGSIPTSSTELSTANGLLQLEHTALPLNGTSQPSAAPSFLPSHLQTQSPSSSKASRPTSPDPIRLKGKPIATDTCIVLSALTSGFKRPNILDLKLGSRLWADDAPATKRARLDQVSRETTSSSLGFRIAGMRVWKGQGSNTISNAHGAESAPSPAALNPSCAQRARRHNHIEYDEENNYLVYNKFYGRAVESEQIIDAFKDYFIVPTSGIHRRHALELINNFRQEIKEIHQVLESVETRMYSSSILLVYEGDPEAYEEALEYQRQKRAAEAQEMAAEGSYSGYGEEVEAETIQPKMQVPSTIQLPTLERNGAEGEVGVEGEADDDEDEEEEEERRTYAVKLIDFAHASWTPGEGPDQNVLQGVQSTIQVLDDLEKHLIDDG